MAEDYAVQVVRPARRFTPSELHLIRQLAAMCRRVAIEHGEARPRAAVADDKLKTIAVRFDPETFAEILTRAEARGVSLAEEVRLLVEWGLEAEILEPPHDR